MAASTLSKDDNKRFLDYEGLAYLLSQLQTEIVGQPGADGKDAKITGVTIDVEPGHLDEPTATAEVTGEPGDQKIHITISGLQGAPGETGPAGEGTPGPAGKDAAIASADASITTEGIETPAVRVTLGGETGAQTMHFDFDLPLKGGSGITEWPGTSDQVLMGDGTPKDLEEFWTLLDEVVQQSHDRALEDMKSKLQTAQDTLASASKSTDGSDVAEDAKWVDDSTYDALQQAITEATEAQGSPDSKDAQELKDLADRLDAATKAFESAKKDGTKASESNKEGLGSAATEAQSTLDGVTSSTDGSDVPADKEWVDQEKYQELQDAIEEANGLAQNDNATKEQVDQSKKRLEAAKEAVESGKQAGSKVTDEHKQQMQQKLTEAQALLASASRSADGTDVDSSAFWVDEDTYDAFKNAIDALDALNKNESASDADVLAALGTLDSTSTAFSTAKKPGTKSGFEPGTSLGDLSWQDLTDFTDDVQEHPEKYGELVGQTKDVTLTGIGAAKIQIIGVAHDDLADGSGKAAFTFQFVDCLETHNMNSSNTTAGGWGDTLMRSEEMTKIYNALPADLKAQVKQVKKKTYNKITVASNPQTQVATGSELEEVNDYMFLLSASEVGKKTNYTGDGNNDYPIVTGEGETYAYYADNDTRANHIKKLSGSAQWWWLRSISVYSASHAGTNFRLVGSSGFVDGSDHATNQGGVAPGFCI